MEPHQGKAAYMAVEYELAGDGIRVLGCLGDTPAVSLPDEAEGMPVREIGPYAFSASRRESKGRLVCELHPEWKMNQMGEDRRICGDKLAEIYLPPSVRGIGRYAFYGCENLELFHMTGGLMQVEGGAFVGCRKIRRLEVECQEGAAGCGCLKQVLEDLPMELEAAFLWKGGQAVVIFPEFYEESVENTPARIIEIHLHGSGSHYRQCFQNGQLDFEAYDRRFPFAKANENPDVVMRIALTRLRWPHHLTAEARRQYAGYLREQIEEAARQILAAEDMEALKLLAAERILNEDTIGRVLDLALVMKKTECTAYLMSLPFRKKAANKVFEF